MMTPKAAVTSAQNSWNQITFFGPTSLSMTSILTWESSRTESEMLSMANHTRQNSASCSVPAGTCLKKYRPKTITMMAISCTVSSTTQTALIT